MVFGVPWGRCYRCGGGGGGVAGASGAGGSMLAQVVTVGYFVVVAR